MFFTLLLERPEGTNGEFAVSSPDVPNCFSCGAIVEAAKANYLEALTGLFEVLTEQGQPLPRPHAAAASHTFDGFGDRTVVFAKVPWNEIAYLPDYPAVAGMGFTRQEALERLTVALAAEAIRMKAAGETLPPRAYQAVELEVEVSCAPLRIAS